MKKSIISKAVGLVMALGSVGASIGVGLSLSKGEISTPVTFVASDTSGYNAAVTIGNYSYKFKGSFDQSSNQFSLKGSVVSRATSSGNGNGSGGFFPGFGGSMNPGGNSGGEKVAVQSLTLSLEKNQAYIGEVIKATATIMPANASSDVEWSSSDENIATVSSGSITPKAEGSVTITATSKEDSSKSASATLTVVKEDYTPYEYSVNGTYSIEDGYGYVITLDDENKTVIHCDYNKIEGRHEFYYTVNTKAGTGFVKFQAKDVQFKSKLAKDYQTWDKRDSKYIFTAFATGNNNSVAYAYMYLHSDGSVVINTPNGVNRAVEANGISWEEDANKNIVVKKGNDTYKADKTVNPDKPGYKISYGSYVFINSQKQDVKWKSLSISDFEGTPVKEFTGDYEISGPGGGSGSLSLELYDGGIAKLYENTWNLENTGTWSEEDGIYTVVFGDKTYTSVMEDDNTTITYTITSQSMWGSDVSTDVILTMKK